MIPKTLFVWIILFCLSPDIVWAQKTDTLYLNNGDRVIGEVKKMQYGILRLSTESMGTVKIEWEDVVRLISDKRYEVILDNTQVIIGYIDSTSVRNVVLQVIPDIEDQVRLKNIVEITPIKNRFWKRFDGGIDFGFSFTKASDVAQLTIDSRVQYKAEKIYGELNLQSITTNNRDDDEETARKQDLGLQVLRVYPKSWYWGVYTALEKNTELGIDLRSRFALGFGKDLIHGASSDLLFTLGANVSNEQTIDSEDSQNSAEGLLSIQFKKFSYKEPEIDISTDFTVFPSITEGGRVRATFDIKASIDLISDVYFSLSFYDNYDSDPPSASASKNDFGIVTSIGYSF